MSRLVGFVSVVLFVSGAGSASADDGKPVAAPPQRHEPAQAAAVIPLPPARVPEQQPSAMRAEDIKGHRYEVKLVRGRGVIGVVRPDDPYEVRDEGGTLRAVSKTPGAPPGLRLWYVGSSNG